MPTISDMPGNVLPRSFYARPTLIVARQLLGARLVRRSEDTVLAGLITETEAYIGEEDLGCHARVGRTPRTAVMYGPPGHAYVYFTYGMHWCLNVVTEREGFPAAVLIRALYPVEGLEVMLKRRRGRGLDGPAKVTQALDISRAQNGLDLTQPETGLWIEAGISIPDSLVTKGPRVGLNSVPEPWKSKPWRFLVEHSKISALVSQGDSHGTLGR